MIALLTGQIVFKSIDHVIVEVGGVGYRLFIPLSSFYSLPEQGTARFFVHTHVREDALLLYGFCTPEEKELFLLLLSVSGVGPKLALNILSHSPVSGLQEALADGDVKRLSSLPGIGKKTAERLILELKEKVGKLAPPARTRTTAPESKAATSFDDALSALINLGYKESQARKVLETLEIPPGTNLEQVLKGALKLLLK
jgi:Holliday junction DNA helicase RuvA